MFIEKFKQATSLPAKEALLNQYLDSICEKVILKVESSNIQELADNITAELKDVQRESFSTGNSSSSFSKVIQSQQEKRHSNQDISTPSQKKMYAKEVLDKVFDNLEGSKPVEQDKAAASSASSSNVDQGISDANFRSGLNVNVADFIEETPIDSKKDMDVVEGLDVQDVGENDMSPVSLDDGTPQPIVNEKNFVQRSSGFVRNIFSKFSLTNFEAREAADKKILLIDALKGNQISFLKEVGLPIFESTLTGSESLLDIALTDRTKSSGADTVIYLLENELSNMTEDSDKQLFLTEKLSDMTLSGKFDRRELDTLFGAFKDTLSLESIWKCSNNIRLNDTKPDKFGRDLSRILKLVPQDLRKEMDIDVYAKNVFDKADSSTFNRFLKDISSMGYSF